MPWPGAPSGLSCRVFQGLGRPYQCLHHHWHQAAQEARWCPQDLRGEPHSSTKNPTKNQPRGFKAQILAPRSPRSAAWGVGSTPKPSPPFVLCSPPDLLVMSLPPCPAAPSSSCHSVVPFQTHGAPDIPGETPSAMQTLSVRMWSATTRYAVSMRPSSAAPTRPA